MMRNILSQRLVQGLKPKYHYQGTIALLQNYTVYVYYVYIYIHTYTHTLRMYTCVDRLIF